MVAKGIVVVTQGYEYTVERFGRYTTSLRPGLHFIIPFIDAIGSRINMMESVQDIAAQEVISRDNATILVDGVCFYQIVDAAKSAYEVNEVQRAIQNLVTTNLRTVMGSLELDQILSERDTINAKLLSVVDSATESWGIKITRVEVKDIRPPQSIVEAMSKQMTSEREKRARILEAEGHRQAEILRAEGEKQSAILESEGRKEAAFRDAEARERMAEAEAKATNMVSEAIAKGDLNAINYFVAQKYTEALAKVGSASNSKVVLMPIEASQILGSLGGIQELFNSVKNTPKQMPKNPTEAS
ncbi:MAG: SPFH/Band 7/PHB domain protein [Hahellaceae bacterium]|nr:SPFH/Band 7/PHB domain protein [Hahellaceae bacterium]MCP5170516.1 SPFH/Band 7/PHB domain protein [Hahellaceae bacterium]